MDDRLRWHGSFRRTDLVGRFEISPQQASADIAALNELSPGGLRYDAASKEHLRGDGYRPLFPKDPARWMEDAEQAGDTSVIRLERLLLPSQRADEEVVAAVIHAYETRTALSVRYQSMTSRAPSERTICPHQMVDTGDRLHVRAWDDRRRIFADFVLARILVAKPRADYPWVDGVADTLWHDRIRIALAPHDALSASQKSAVEREFGMVRGRTEIEARQAMVIYHLERLGLLDAVARGQGAAAPVLGVRCVNADELRPLLPGQDRQAAPEAPPPATAS